jgi:tripartite-type tricarboxylate transporter receptor subunit TctC
VRVLALAEVRKKLNDLGLDVVGGTPAEFSAVIAREIPQWATVIKAAGIKLSD